jgi:hypothetical protein
MVRPYAGIGAGYTKKLIVSNLPAEVGNDKQESGHGMGLAAWPGVLVRTMVAGKYPVGIDVRYALMPSAESAITGFGTAGMVF